MKIELRQIKIGAIALDYRDNAEDGVVGYGGNLDIRPPYQREFVYKDAKRNAVIDTILKGFPLNVMYWAKKEDGTYEVLDGQQRTISFCQYINGEYSININGIDKPFHSLTDYEQEKILDYEVMVYICEGSDKERLDWFTTINIAGEKLTDQELLNINYTGTWLSDAKKKFSKTGCVASKMGDKYIKGVANRQEILELALTWIVGDKKKISSYMAEHQRDANANELWFHFRNVIDWVEQTFPRYRKEMKGLDWGRLYDEYHENIYDTNKLEEQISALMADEEVTSKKGVYEYVLSNCMKERVLSVRAFSEKDKRTVYEQQEHICPICGKEHPFESMHGDHIVEWSKGGRTVVENLQMVCHDCHKELTRTMFD